MMYKMKQYLLHCVVEIIIIYFIWGCLYYFTMQRAEPHLPIIALEKSRQIQQKLSQNAPFSSAIKGPKDIQYTKEVLILFLLWKVPCTLTEGRTYRCLPDCENFLQ